MHCNGYVGLVKSRGQHRWCGTDGCLFYLSCEQQGTRSSYGCFAGTTRCLSCRKKRADKRRLAVAVAESKTMDTSYTHELVLWKFFMDNPVQPKCHGRPAQQALFNAGTIANGRVYVQLATQCGFEGLGLFSRCKYTRGDVVTLYFGVIVDHNNASKTHSRSDHIGLGRDRAFDGLPCSSLFRPDPDGTTTEYRPASPNALLNTLIENCGCGYMANTSSKRCDSKLNKRTNVLISPIDIVLPGTGVPYGRVLALICGKHDINPGDELISAYEIGDIHRDLNFYCIDSEHCK
jgi:hypothetical protein